MRVSLTANATAMAAWIMASATLVWRAHLGLVSQDAQRPQNGVAYAVSGHMRRVLAGTYRAAAADGDYLRAVNVFGSKDAARRGYPQLAALLWSASCLDASFAAPYLLAGTALSSIPAYKAEALSLLARGSAFRSDVWLISFLYAFELFERGQLREAAMHMSTAAKAEGAPAYVASLAARLAADSGEPRLGLVMLETLAQNARDQGTKDLFEARRLALLWQEQQHAWQQAVNAFVKQHARLPRDVKEMWEQASPTNREALPLLDPFGAPFFLTPAGDVTSDNANAQLHVHREGEAP